MSTGGPDLFVICKNCGAEVSPYITECPYCGNRLRKRAPKLDRHGRISERLNKRPPTPSLPRLRRGEIPGIRHDTRPYVTLALLLLGVVGCVIWRTSFVMFANLIVFPIRTDWWRAFTSPFIYTNMGYAFACLCVIALYGTLLERRSGPVVVLVLFAVGAFGGAALAGKLTLDLALGGNGGALALLCAWAVPDLIRVRRGEEIDGDLIGTAVLGLVVALMPLATVEANWIPDAVGVAAGAVLGYPLARAHHL